MHAQTIIIIIVIRTQFEGDEMDCAEKVIINLN